MSARPFRRLIALVQTLALLGLASCTAATQAPREPAGPAAAPSEYRVSAGPAPETRPAPAAPEQARKSELPRTAEIGPARPAAPMPVTPPSAQAGQRILESVERAKRPPGPVVQAQGAAAEPGREEAQQPALRPRRGSAGAAQTGQTASPQAQAPGRLVVFNFDNADIEVVLQATSELLVFNYVLAPGARGKKVTVQTTGRIPVDDIFPVLLTILDVNGLSAVRSGNVYRIIPKEGAAQTSTRTVVGTELDRVIPGDEVLTMVIPLKFVVSTDLAGLLRPFVPQQGALTAHRDTNLLVITDSAANIRRLLEIVKLIDVDVALSELQIFTLKFADAQDVAQILTQLFSSGRLRPGGAQLPPGVSAPAPAPGAPPRAGAAPAGSDAGAADRAVLIVPERRSNSIIVYARKPDLETISRLVERLDTDVYGGQRIFIYFCENAKARELTSTLDAIFGRASSSGSTTSTSTTAPGATRPGTTGVTMPSQASVQQPLLPRGGAAGGPGGVTFGEGLTVGSETRFVADEITNSIIVTTYPRLWAEVEPIIKKLDKSPRQVLIEVLALEVTLGDSNDLGLAWAVRSGRFDLRFRANPDAAPGVGQRPPPLIPPFADLAALPSGLTFFTFATEQFFAALHVLGSESKINVVSTPSILTAENKKAVINVSRSVPVLTSQQTQVGGTTTTTPGTSTGIVGTQTVEYKDVGIILTVTPRIGEQGTVALEVKQEFNEVGREQVPPTNSPEFLKREAETTVVLGNNQALILGGLILTRKTTAREGIPLLYKIPIIGYLFGSTSERTEKTELIILVTPRVVGSAVDAARLTDEKRRMTPEFRDIMRRYPRSPFWQDQ